MQSIQKSPPKFSIIVPIYNVESFLKECIDSVLLQDFQDYELICINDGSTDNSLEVLKSFHGLSFKQKIALRFPWILNFYQFAKKLIKK